MSAWVIVVLTAALVLITGYYAWMNRRMVEEMADARRQAVLPKLAITLDPLGPLYSKVKLVNVGTGAALDVRVDLRFEVEGEGSDTGLVREWRRHVIVPGESAEFDTPDDSSGRTLPSNELGDVYRRIRLRGSMRDVLGREHEVDETIEGLKEWFEMLEKADQYLPTDRLEEIAKAIKDLGGEVKAARRTLEAEMASLRSTADDA